MVIPYWKNGAIVYFVSRSRPDCKYPESKYRKMKIDEYNDHCPWGLDTLNRQSDVLIIAEGAFDAMSAYQQGYPVLSAITGHFSSKQLQMNLDKLHEFSASTCFMHARIAFTPFVGVLPWADLPAAS